MRIHDNLDNGLVLNRYWAISKSVRTLLNQAMNICSTRGDELTNSGRVMHICVGNLTIIGSNNNATPSHYLNQCWNIFYLTLRNKLQWNNYRNSYILIEENPFEMLCAKWWPFCLGLNMLTFLTWGIVYYLLSISMTCLLMMSGIESHEGLTILAICYHGQKICRFSARKHLT